MKLFSYAAAYKEKKEVKVFLTHVWANSIGEATILSKRKIPKGIVILSWYIKPAKYEKSEKTEVKVNSVDVLDEHFDAIVDGIFTGELTIDGIVEKYKVNKTVTRRFVNAIKDDVKKNTPSKCI